MEASDINKMGPEQLNILIDKKVEWLRKVVRFVSDMVQECGTGVEKGGESSCHTPVKGELYNFNDFSFYAEDLEQTQKGGNDITIWFHPKPGLMSRADLRSENPVLKPVLKFCFAAVSPDPDDGVEIQAEDGEWKKLLDEMILFPDKFIGLHKARLVAEAIRLEKEGTKFEAGRDQERKLLELRTRAEKLKV